MGETTVMDGIEWAFSPDAKTGEIAWRSEKPGAALPAFLKSHPAIVKDRRPGPHNASAGSIWNVKPW